MADFFSTLKTGISSDSGISQSSSGFRQLNPPGLSGRQSYSAADDPWNNERLKALVQERLQANQERQLQAMAGSSTTIKPLERRPGANPYGVQRLPWIFSTFSDLMSDPTRLNELTPTTGNLPANTIVWYANPKSVDWVISQRGSESKTKSGTVLHIWRDRLRRSDYDDPKINITFQSGNIMPVYDNGLNPNNPTSPPDQGQSLPPGLNDFYKYLELVDASKIKNGRANLVHILYRSRIFPSIVLTGFFEPQAVVRFSDSSDNPFQINGWTSTFTIYQTIPAINNWADLARQFQQEFRTNEPFNRVT